MANNFRSKIIKSVNINGFYLEVCKVWNGKESEAWFEFMETNRYGSPDDNYEDPVDCSSAYQALKMMENRAAELKGEPNWAAQEAYDSAHGTINGQDPGIVEMRELWG